MSDINPILFATIALAGAFLLGSTPTALLLGKLKGIDVRKHGSGNIGATNAFRVLGKALGILCLVVDILKGFIPAAAFAIDAWGDPWAQWHLNRGDWSLIVGIAAILGHMFSPWIGFKGGKGVATSVGVFLAVAPIPVLICFGAGIALIAATGYVSLASLVGAALLPVLVAVLPPGGERSYFLLTVTTLLGAFIIYKHRANIGRLMRGEENRILYRKDAGEEGKAGNA